VLFVRIIVNAVALVVAALLVPGIRLKWGAEPTQTAITLLVLAIVFAVINSYVRPILKVLSLPINLLTLGTFSFAVNAGMLLLLAWVVDLIWKPVFTLGGFPSTEITPQTLVAAVAGSLVVSVVSTALTILMPEA
jgi:putative membrane protein